MKTVCASIVALCLIALVAGPVAARPPYPAIFKAKYENLAKEVDTAKCLVCHKGKEKKDRNEYGIALSKAFGKADFEKNKGDKEALAKHLTEALDKVAEEKNADGKTFGELIKAGHLPGGEAK